MDVTVIGAGVYGAAVAASLTRRGVAVTVVDAGRPACGTSGVTFSWTNSCGKQPRSYHDLNVAGMEAHRRLAPHGDWYHESGNLEWAADDAAREELRAKVDGVLAYGYEARWIGREEALALEPGLDPAVLPEDGIAYFPREGWVDPAGLVDHLLAGADVVAGDAVVALEPATGEVRLASGTGIAGDAVVNCAGPGAAEVAALAGMTLPLRNLPCTLVETAPVEVPVTRIVHAPTVHSRPSVGGRVLLHSPEFNGVADPSDELLAAGRALYPGLGAATGAARVGVRPIPADGLPVLGRVRDVPNFYFAVSHSGVTLCLHTGELVAAEVTGEDRDEVLAPYRFERF